MYSECGLLESFGQHSKGVASNRSDLQPRTVGHLPPRSFRQAQGTSKSAFAQHSKEVGLAEQWGASLGDGSSLGVDPP